MKESGGEVHVALREALALEGELADRFALTTVVAQDPLPFLKRT